MTTHISAPADTDETEAIRKVVAVVEHAQNNELVDEFLGLFRQDAIWTTGGGKRLYGLAEIADFTRQVLPGGMRDASVRFELEHLSFIRPDVAAVKLRQVYRTADGVDVGSPLWVMSKEDGEWRLTACQNTGAADEEASPNRPIFGTSE